MEQLFNLVYKKYKNYIKNNLLFFTDCIFDYFDSTVEDENEIAIISVKKSSSTYEANIRDVIECNNSFYIVGFLYPSEVDESYCFKKFYINENKLFLSSFSIMNHIKIIKKDIDGNENLQNIKGLSFDETNAKDIYSIFLMKVTNIINGCKNII